MGLVILGALIIYVLISIVVVLLAIRHAKRNGKSATRWGWGAALVMYLIPFWDWLPTVVLHRYYCATEAGFWVYKTVDQWGKEHPGVIETLNPYTNLRSQHFKSADGRLSERVYALNERFSWIVTQKDEMSLLHIIRKEQKVVDVNQGVVLARLVDFASGNSVKNTIPPPGPWKFWSINRNCNGGDKNQGLMYSFQRSVKGANQ